MPSIVRHKFDPNDELGAPLDILGNPKCRCGRPESAPEHKPGKKEQDAREQ